MVNEVDIVIIGSHCQNITVFDKESKYGQNTRIVQFTKIKNTRCKNTFQYDIKLIIFRNFNSIIKTKGKLTVSVVYKLNFNNCRL
jgi:hypothetical protein